jgi:hypothetical protein
VRLEQISRSPAGNQSPLALYLNAIHSKNTVRSFQTWYDEVITAEDVAHPSPYNGDNGSLPVPSPPRKARKLGRAIDGLDRAGANPRVPLSTCDGQTDYRLHHRVDLLFPIRLANLASEQSLLAGPVTLVGKLVRAVNDQHDEYVDDASFNTWGGPTYQIGLLEHNKTHLSGLWDELDADAVVLYPGAVILPIAIYK